MNKTEKTDLLLNKLKEDSSEYKNLETNEYNLAAVWRIFRPYGNNLSVSRSIQEMHTFPRINCLSGKGILQD